MLILYRVVLIKACSRQRAVSIVILSIQRRSVRFVIHTQHSAITTTNQSDCFIAAIDVIFTAVSHNGIHTTQQVCLCLDTGQAISVHIICRQACGQSRSECGTLTPVEGIVTIDNIDAFAAHDDIATGGAKGCKEFIARTIAIHSECVIAESAIHYNRSSDRRADLEPVVTGSAINEDSVDRILTASASDPDNIIPISCSYCDRSIFGSVFTTHNNIDHVNARAGVEINFVNQTIQIFNLVTVVLAGARCSNTCNSDSAEDFYTQICANHNKVGFSRQGIQTRGQIVKFSGRIVSEIDQTFLE